MTRFRQDNTEGYTSTDLAALNEAFDKLMGEVPATLAGLNCLERKSFEDSTAERLLADYDAGKRGADLTV